MPCTVCRVPLNKNDSRLITTHTADDGFLADKPLASSSSSFNMSVWKEHAICLGDFWINRSNHPDYLCLQEYIVKLCKLAGDHALVSAPTARAMCISVGVQDCMPPLARQHETTRELQLPVTAAFWEP